VNWALPGGATLVVASRRPAAVRSAGCLDAHGRQCTPIAGQGQSPAGTQRIVIASKRGMCRISLSSWRGGRQPRTPAPPAGLFKRGVAGWRGIL